MTALVVRNDAKASLQVTRQPFPRAPRARHAVDGQHDRPAFTPALDRREGAIVECDARR
jgi:hypothetical protein